MNENDLSYVVKRDGTVAEFDKSRILKQIGFATEGLDGVSAEELFYDLIPQLQDGVSTQEIQTLLIKTAGSKTDVDKPNYQFVASRLFLNNLYHKVGKKYNAPKGKAYSHSLAEYIKLGKEIGRIISDIDDGYDLDELNSYIKPERDMQFTYLGVITLHDRYLLKDGDPIELPQHMFMSIAMFLAKKDVQFAKEIYDALSQFEMMVATPTLSNGRTPHHQLSSCFLKGTKIRTIDGLKDIDLLNTDDYVLTHKNRFRKVEELMTRNYSSDLYSLKIHGISDLLTATEEHPILTLDGQSLKCIRKHGSCLLNQGKKEICFKTQGEYKNDCEKLAFDFKEDWKAINKIEIGDYVSVAFPREINHLESLFVSNYVIDKDLIINDGYIQYKRTNASLCNNSNRSFLNTQIKPIKNEILFNSDFMLLVGYYLAEGNINQDLSSVQFTFSINEQNYVNDVSRIIKELFDVETMQYVSMNTKSVTVHNVILARFFYALFGTGFNKIRIPNELIYANPEIQKYLLVGAIRGDGCNNGTSYELTMANKPLINQLFEIALRCGLSPSQRDDKNLATLATVKASHLIIPRRDTEFCKLVDKNIHKFNAVSEVNQLNLGFWWNENYYLKVLEVTTKPYSGVVYNIEVEEDHSYSVSNIAVHNCFVGSTDDNIESIFDSYKDMALLSKFGGKTYYCHSI